MAYGQIVVARDYEISPGFLDASPMAAVKIYKGGLVGWNSDGYLTFMAATANMPFAGVSYETIDNSAGVAGAKTMRYERSGIVTLKIVGATQAVVGLECYVEIGANGDNATVTTTAPAGLGCKVGRIVEFISATEVRVSLTGYACVTQAAAT
jgi:hypothetical protein